MEMDVLLYILSLQRVVQGELTSFGWLDVKKEPASHQVPLRAKLLLRNCSFQNRESEETLIKWIARSNEEPAPTLSRTVL